MEKYRRENDRLVQFHTRFRRSTFSELQRLEKETGKSKAEIIREIVRTGLRTAEAVERNGIER